MTFPKLMMRSTALLKLLFCFAVEQIGEEMLDCPQKQKRHYLHIIISKQILQGYTKEDIPQ